jgi:hypothetical protein
MSCFEHNITDVWTIILCMIVCDIESRLLYVGPGEPTRDVALELARDGS